MARRKSEGTTYSKSYAAKLARAAKRGLTPYEARKAAGLAKGESASQAVGKPRKGELAVIQERLIRGEKTRKFYPTFYEAIKSGDPDAIETVKRLWRKDLKHEPPAEGEMAEFARDLQMKNAEMDDQAKGKKSRTKGILTDSGFYNNFTIFYDVPYWKIINMDTGSLVFRSRVKQDAENYWNTLEHRDDEAFDEEE